MDLENNKHDYDCKHGYLCLFSKLCKHAYKDFVMMFNMLYLREMVGIQDQTPVRCHLQASNIK